MIFQCGQEYSSAALLKKDKGPKDLSKNEETQVFILFFWNFYYVYNFLSDYDAPVTENGAYTPKYDKAAEMIATYDSLANVISKPERPEYISPQAYPNVKLNQYLTLEQLLDNVVCTYD